MVFILLKKMNKFKSYNCYSLIKNKTAERHHISIQIYDANLKSNIKN